MTATASMTDAPTHADLSPGRAVPTLVRSSTVRAGAWLTRAVITGWRYVRTVLAAIRLGLVWRTFCANTGLAMRKVRTDEFGDLHIRVYAMPRLTRVRVDPHGWTMRVRLRPGQHLDQYANACLALRQRGPGPDGQGSRAAGSTRILGAPHLTPRPAHPGCRATSRARARPVGVRLVGDR